MSSIKHLNMLVMINQQILLSLKLFEANILTIPGLFG